MAGEWLERREDGELDGGLMATNGMPAFCVVCSLHNQHPCTLTPRPVLPADHCTLCPNCFFSFCALCEESWHPGT